MYFQAALFLTFLPLFMPTKLKSIGPPAAVEATAISSGLCSAAECMLIMAGMSADAAFVASVSTPPAEAMLDSSWVRFAAGPVLLTLGAL